MTSFYKKEYTQNYSCCYNDNLYIEIRIVLNHRRHEPKISAEQRNAEDDITK